MQINDFSQTLINNQLPQVGNLNHKTDKELMNVSQDFESLFIAQLFKEMKKSVSTLSEKGFLNGGMAEDIFKDMLYDKYANEAAHTNSIGLAKMVYDSLTQQRGSL
jgi:flagellar protein FlgJ